MDTPVTQTLTLKDPSLLKQACLLGGQWVGDPADPVDNPATGEMSICYVFEEKVVCTPQTSPSGGFAAAGSAAGGPAPGAPVAATPAPAGTPSVRGAVASPQRP